MNPGPCTFYTSCFFIYLYNNIYLFIPGRGDQEVREADSGGRESGADHDEDSV